MKINMAVLKKNAFFSGPTTEGIEEIKTFSQPP